MYSSFTDIRNKTELTQEDIAKLNTLDRETGNCEGSSLTGYRNNHAIAMIVVIGAGKALGKIEYNVMGEVAIIVWIVSNGVGDVLHEIFEKNMHQKGINEIQAKCSLSDTEKPSTVLHRLNFYIKHRYRALTITQMICQKVVEDEPEDFILTNIVMVKRLDGQPNTYFP